MIVATFNGIDLLWILGALVLAWFAWRDEVRHDEREAEQASWCPEDEDDEQVAA